MGAEAMVAAKTGASIRGRLREHEPMARHCSWRAGGSADRFFEPADLDDLCAFLAGVDEAEPLLWMGLGSNLLVRDGGFRGTVICLAGALDELRLAGPQAVYGQAGVPCARIARFAARRGLGGAEFLAGIPGTLGGALAMNAGAFGAETWPVVARVETLDRQGRRRWRPHSDFSVGYRSVAGTVGEWFIAAELALVPDPAGSGQARIRELLAQRQRSQPIGVPSCGSVFRNPPGDFAGRLIEASGLKGARSGGCHVSTKHANFIVNDAAASAGDIEALIERVRDTVARDHGVILQAEVRIVGESA
ncbi:MAG: UDP-N-acetylmuramate dehydrogenase [Gammaproteobacteria bacterium]